MDTDKGDGKGGGKGKGEGKGKGRGKGKGKGEGKGRGKGFYHRDTEKGRRQTKRRKDENTEKR